MKIHINKEKKEQSGCFGGAKSWTIVSAYYELSSEERNLLNSNSNLLNMTVFNLQFRGPDGNPSGESSRTVKQLTNEKYVNESDGYPLGCFFTNGEIQEVEEMINAGAKNLKAELYGGSEGSTTTEI
ncbi:MAG: hypothetical protein WCG08_15345 [Paludibacter sp.]